MTMKKILLIALVFFKAITSFAQPASAQPTLIAPNIDTLMKYNGTYTQANITDSLRGGKFNLKDTTGLVADGGIVLTSAKPNKYWVRDATQMTNGFAPEWWGAKGDSINNDAPAIQAALNFDFSHRSRNGNINVYYIPRDAGGNWGYFKGVGGVRLREGKTYLIKQIIIIFAGQKLDLNNSTITTTDSLQALIQTPLGGFTQKVWNGKDSINAYTTADKIFSQKNIIICNGILDGHNVAHMGLRLESVAEGTISNLTVVRITGRKWADSTRTVVENETSSLWIRVSSTAGLVIGDVIRFFNVTTGAYRHEIFRVLSTNGDTVFFNQDNTGTNAVVFDMAQAGDYFDYFPTGVIAGCTQTTFNILVSRYNRLGLYVGNGQRLNGDSSFNGGDNRFYSSFITENDMGVAIKRNVQTFYGGTIMHNAYEQIYVSCDNLSLKDKIYIEVNGQYRGLDNEKYALCYFRGKNITIDAFIPSNNGSFNFFRRFYVAANSKVYITLDDVSTNNVEPNPLHPTDIAVVMMQDPATSWVSLELLAEKNLSQPDSVKLAVIDTNYAPVSTKALINAFSNGGIHTLHGAVGLDSLNFYNGSTLMTSISGNGLWINNAGSLDAGIWNTRSGWIGFKAQTKFEIPARWNYPMYWGNGSRYWVDSSLGTYGRRLRATQFSDPVSDGDPLGRTFAWTIDSSYSLAPVYTGTKPPFKTNIVTIFNSNNKLAYTVPISSVAYSRVFDFGSRAEDDTIHFLITKPNDSLVNKHYVDSAAAASSTVKPQVLTIATTGTTVSLSTTSYCVPGQMATTYGAEAARKTVFPVAGTVGNLRVVTSGSQSGTGSLVITIRQAGSGTAVTTTVAAGASAGTFTDLTHTVHFAVTDGFSIELANNATAASAGITCISLTFTPD